MSLGLALRRDGEDFAVIKRNLTTGKESDITTEDLSILLKQEEERRKAEENLRAVRQRARAIHDSTLRLREGGKDGAW